MRYESSRNPAIWLVESFLANNLRTRFFPDMQFSQNDIANYGASVKAQKVMLLSLNGKCCAFGPNLSCLPNYLDNKFNFLKSNFVIFSYIRQNILLQKIKKTHCVHPEKNASQMDGQTGKLTDEQDWFYRTPSTKMEVWSCFLETRQENFLKLFGLIVNHMERISARKWNRINIVQGSKSSKTMILSKFT